MITWLRQLFRDDSAIAAGDSDRLFGAMRSAKWPKVRDAWLKTNPRCRVCGSRNDVEVHHKTPVHVDGSLELDPRNLMTLCRAHHFTFGHLGNWASWNPEVDIDVEVWMRKFNSRPKLAGLTVIVMFLVALQAVALPSIGALSEGSHVGPGGTEAACQIPMDLRKKNIGSPPPHGPGCCVFRSIDHAARYQNVPALVAFPEWMVSNGVRGGGWPQKVSELVPRICRDRGVPEPPYIQHTNGDIEFLYSAVKTGRTPCVTYAGRDMHYGPRTRIAHMVNLVHLDPPGRSPRLAAILDNNFTGENQIVWMLAEEFRDRWQDMDGGWAIVLLAPPPPPKPQP